MTKFRDRATIGATQDWVNAARDNQLPPDTDWRIWLVLGGRGAGKTRTGAEWIRAKVAAGAEHIALVAPTLTDAREVMLEGESGLLNIGYPRERPRFIASRRRLEWPDGAVGHIYTAEDPDGLRGPQFDAAWADEFCAWTYPEDTLSNLRLALRLGAHPRLVVTTTPRPIPALLSLMEEIGVAVSRARTRENTAHLSPSFLADMEASYGGTALGRQELDGEIVTEFPGALWTLQVLAKQRVEATPDLDRILVAIDPPASSGPKADACGIIVAGRAGDRAYVLADATVHRAPPQDWATRAVALYHQYNADALLAETNQGGEMIAAVIHQIDPNVNILTVHATKSKTARAEPVANLYVRERVYHVGRFDALESELILMGVPGLRRSPDRADALVWAVHSLLLKQTYQPRVRGL